jgi:5'-3' exonuclease
MQRLDKHLKFFVRHKLAMDSSWAKMKVLYSGYDVPGEGEHKIMEYIRYEARSRPALHRCQHVLILPSAFWSVPSAWLQCSVS